MRRLHRSRHERMIAGVAGGIAKYFDIDPTVIRLVWIVAAIPGLFPALFAYLLCWILIPPEPIGGAV